jgi:hypothetical protein
MMDVSLYPKFITILNVQMTNNRAMKYVMKEVTEIGRITENVGVRTSVS